MVEKGVATIAIIGSRLAATPGLSGRMFTALAQERINVDCISSSEMTMSCVIASRISSAPSRPCTTSFLRTRPRRKSPAGSRRQVGGNMFQPRAVGRTAAERKAAAR